jgi:hypothetical protein
VQCLLEALTGIGFLAVGLEDVWGLTHLEVDVAWDYASSLWSSAIEIEGKIEVIDLSGFVLGGPCTIYFVRPSIFLRKRDRHLWFGCQEKVVRHPSNSCVGNGTPLKKNLILYMVLEDKVLIQVDVS